MSMHLVIVEDDEGCLSIMEIMMRAMGYQVTGFASGEAAVDYFIDHHELADAILLDIMMPGMDGFGVLHRLRNIPGWSKVPVIVQSGAVMEEDQRRAAALGAAAYLFKPFSYRELASLVHQVVGRPLIAVTG